MAGAFHALAKCHLARSDDNERPANLYGLSQFWSQDSTRGFLAFPEWMRLGDWMIRIYHFAAMIGFLSFVPGHLLMVALHGWSNFYSMLTGWKLDPDYLAKD